MPFVGHIARLRSKPANETAILVWHEPSWDEKLVRALISEMVGPAAELPSVTPKLLRS